MGKAHCTKISEFCIFSTSEYFESMIPYEWTIRNAVLFCYFFSFAMNYSPRLSSETNGFVFFSGRKNWANYVCFPSLAFHYKYNFLQILLLQKAVFRMPWENFVYRLQYSGVFVIVIKKYELICIFLIREMFKMH